MGFAALLSQSFRMTLRDWRSGEVRLLVVALAVAVAALKAVSSAYPLRGTIKLRGAQGEIAAAGGPEAGTAWVDPQLLDSLDLAAGQSIRLGESTFRVSGVIASEPDRGAQFMSFAPR